MKCSEERSSSAGRKSEKLGWDRFVSRDKEREKEAGDTERAAEPQRGGLTRKNKRK